MVALKGRLELSREGKPFQHRWRKREIVFGEGLLIFVDLSDKQSDSGSPELQEHTTWLRQIPTLFKEGEGNRALSLAKGFEAALQYEEVVAVVSDHRYMRSGFAFLTDGLEARGIFAGLGFRDCLRDSSAAGSAPFEELVSIDGQSIKSVLGKNKSLWATRADAGLRRAPRRVTAMQRAVVIHINVVQYSPFLKPFAPVSCIHRDRLVLPVFQRCAFLTNYARVIVDVEQTYDILTRYLRDSLSSVRLDHVSVYNIFFFVLASWLASHDCRCCWVSFCSGSFWFQEIRPVG